jgi:malonate transporter
MPSILFLKLLAIFIVVAIGWVVGRLKWLGQGDVARILANTVFYIFIPALLFRTMVRLDIAHLPASILSAFFVPASFLLLGVYLWNRVHLKRNPAAELPITAPSVRAMSASFGNNVQVGLPLVSALFGEPGLAIHIAIISLHSLILMTTATALAESDLARQHRAEGGARSRLRTLGLTAKNMVLHPVVLPILCGIVWQTLLGRLPTVLDEILLTLSQAVVPVCLILIGVSLAQYGIRGGLRPAIFLTALKLLLLPLMVWGACLSMGLSGVSLAVPVLAAGLPIGTNAMIFAQRYQTLEGESTTAVVLSTFCFIITAPLWLAILASTMSQP